MEALKQKLEATIGPIEQLTPLAGGACQENFQICLADGTRLVLRSDATTSLPGSLRRHQEFEVIAFAREAGVPTPASSHLLYDLLRENSSAYFLDWVEGTALGGKVVRSPELAEARQNLTTSLAEAAARLHRHQGQLPFLEKPDDPVTWALDFQRRTLDQLPRPRPGLEIAYRWLQENRPRRRPVVLVHGDFRMGNFMVCSTGLKAVLDWEFAHYGDPLEDLAWFCVRDWRFGKVKQPAGGICSRQTWAKQYQKAGGFPVDPMVLHYWEVFGNLRWGAGAQAQGLRFLEGQEPRLELLAIARRVAEMEYEALRLIEVGPESW